MPVLVLGLTFGVAVLCVAGIVLAYSSGEVSSQDLYLVPLAQFQPGGLAKGLMGVSAFMWVWLTLLLFAAGQYMVAHMVADWYYERSRCLCADLAKSLGSLAFGSLLCTLLLVVKWMLALALSYNSRFNGHENRVAQCFNRCALCCISLFERCVRFVSEQAYIVMAAGGDSFLSSAEEAVDIIASKPLLFAVCEAAAGLVAGFTKALIVVLSTLSSYLILTETSIGAHVYELWWPVLLFVMVSYPGAAAMMSFFEHSANAILLLFMKDRQKLLSSGKVPESLKDFIDEYH